MALAGLALAVILWATLGGCGGSSDQASEKESATAEQGTAAPEKEPGAPAQEWVGHGSAVARCGDAALGTDPDSWRENATHVGDLGFIGGRLRGVDFRMASRAPGRPSLLVIKAPVIVEGSEHVTVAIAPADRSRAALFFAGGRLRPDGRERAYVELRFEPCPNRARTTWPGGFFLRGRDAVMVLIREEDDGSEAELMVGQL
jgi:hypothetical protein